MLIGDLLTRNAEERRDAPALSDSGLELSWRELDALVERLRGALRERGFEPGDRVAVLARNSREFAALTFACARAGLVLVCLNWRLLPEELSLLLADSRARALFAGTELAAAVSSAARGLELRVGIGVGEVEGFTPYDELVASSHRAAPAVRVEAHDVAVQMYTSGTTGRPKGAMLTHANLTSLASVWAEEIGLGADDHFLQVTPLFHVGGMLMLISAATAGAKLSLHAEFMPDLALKALREDGITHSLFVPAMLQWMMMQPDVERGTYERLRLVAYGAAPATPELLRRVRDVFGCELLQGYGLTETAGVLTILRPEDHRHDDPVVEEARLASAGKPVRCAEVRVVDERGSDTAPGDVGEIVARGENVFPGYWRRPAETAANLVDGWFRTGDLARVDSDGFLTIVDRKKDMILVGGENVYPGEIERVLLGHADVVDACVIGIPHEVWGEEVLGIVQLAEDVEPDARALVGHCRARLARFKCPTRVEFVDALPRNAAGKCEKAALRAPYWEGRSRKV